jgi:hypothetical protein
MSLFGIERRHELMACVQMVSPNNQLYNEIKAGYQKTKNFLEKVLNTIDIRSPMFSMM